MRPVLALVGRPNVGKSTLFNKLTNRRDALVADVPGLTRDRRYGHATIEDQACTLIDTGGLFGEAGDLSPALEYQAELAIDESNAVLFLVDGRAGLTPIDQDIATLLRRRELAVMLVVNKMDGANHDEAVAEFATLGFQHVVYVSAAHGRGLMALSAELQDLIPQQGDESVASTEAVGAVRMAIIGRPNVGKSTLGNRLLGEERLVVYDQPGTTRDAISIAFVRAKKNYVLIDTAGVRRKGRVEGVVEKFSVVKALQAIDEAHVVILVMDANEGVVDQDLHILSYAVDAGAGVIVAMNKWDGLRSDERRAVRRTLDRRLKFAPWITFMEISALHGTGVGHLMREVDRVFKAGQFDVGTSVLTRLLQSLVEAHSPPTVRGRGIKLRYAHKVGSHPPRIAIYGNQTQMVPVSYRRYLQNGFRDALDLVGNPVHLELKTGKNPYAGKRNELNKRQQAQRRRIIKHRKKRKKGSG